MVNLIIEPQAANRLPVSVKLQRPLQPSGNEKQSPSHTSSRVGPDPGPDPYLCSPLDSPQVPMVRNLSDACLRLHRARGHRRQTLIPPTRIACVKRHRPGPRRDRRQRRLQQLPSANPDRRDLPSKPGKHRHRALPSPNENVFNSDVRCQLTPPFLPLHFRTSRAQLIPDAVQPRLVFRLHQHRPQAGHMPFDRARITGRSKPELRQLY